MEHLAELADLDATYLGQIERGQGNATVRVLGQLSTALGVELDGLVGPNATASEAALRRAVGKKIRGMNMNELRVLARILEAIG
jgi:transcriptional regulator with XRE-family HTH domain